MAPAGSASGGRRGWVGGDLAARRFAEAGEKVELVDHGAQLGRRGQRVAEVFGLVVQAVPGAPGGS